MFKNSAFISRLNLNSLLKMCKLELNRGGAVLEKPVGADYAGIIYSDRLRSYRGVASSRNQLCWAHLLRNIKGLGQRAGPSCFVSYLKEALEAKWSGQPRPALFAS
jgi:hypothetical protein